MAKTNPFTFLQQVRQETAKVSWPTRKETVISTIMVFVMVAFAAIFFFVADLVLQSAVGFIMNGGL
ncbi:preprotein translocase subunit SecE [Aurantimonas sp. Leaf443]|uniref:preprotein translocase subunit SecE n=1 Tax=Aurantimonas sp. Leaf443 TaxID=1736378 RepID=UPI0006FD1120|nr:preprotein translocase subunit SecE [Aurantimonas sp. Leaf443]KQT83371.1 preprotein translocase subunit SecE [Aurantimonas sp. Leaf443]